MKSKIILSFILLSFFYFTSLAGVTILPNDPNIQYIGRFDNTNPLSPKISWTGTQIVAKFQGTSLQMIMNSSTTVYYNINIDGVTNLLTLQSGNITYPLCVGLKDTIHTVSIYKRETPWQPQNFNGFIIDDGKSLVNPPDRKIRKIEFYGDSQTQGAQVEVPGLGGDLTSSIYDNNYYSFASITARALYAEYMCIARSGATLTPIAGKIDIPSVYDRTGEVASTYSLWDFNSWIPDVVCINLGVNDSPLPADFTSRYVTFIQNIRAKRPNAYIFVLSGPMSNSASLKSAINAAVTNINSLGDIKVYYYGFTTIVNHSGHPRTAESVACAKELVTKIKSVIWAEVVPNLAVEDVYITPISNALVIGGTQQLSSTVTPFDAIDKTVSWSSSNSNILTIDGTGFVTALAAGTAIVTATSHDGGKKYSSSFTITEPIKTNLLINSGFESALTSGWTGDWGNSKQNSGNQRSGIYYLELGPNAGGRAQPVTSGFVAGSTYTLSAWTKILTGTAGSSYIGVQCFDALGTKLNEFRSTNITSSISFEQKVVTFIVPANTVRMVAFGYLGAASSSISFDDFELIFGTKSTTGLVAPKSTDNSVTLYPNPAKGDLLIICANGIEGIKDISIIDLSGKILFTQLLQNVEIQTINIKELGLKGSYIAKIQSNKQKFSQLLIF